MKGPRLRLDKISRLNMGDYLCVASNGIPPSASNRFSIRVQCESCQSESRVFYTPSYVLDVTDTWTANFIGHTRNTH